MGNGSPMTLYVYLSMWVSYKMVIGDEIGKNTSPLTSLKGDAEKTPLL